MYIPIYLILFIVAVFLTNEKLKQKDLKNLHFYGTAIGFFGGIVLAIFAHAFLIKKIKSPETKKSFHGGVVIGILASIALYFLVI